MNFTTETLQRINQDLTLTKVTQNKTQEKQEPITLNVDHVVVIDCSGSMYSDLPKIRHQLKNKLSDMVKENDTITIVWFSGKGQAGILKNRVQISNLSDLKALHDAIDRFLHPMGLTGFVDPLTLVETIAKGQTKDRLLSMFFITDGYDNTSNKNDIFAVIEKLTNVVDNAVFVEFGYYCNKPLMQDMAEKMGGQVIFSESFESYDVLFKGYLNNKIKSNNKVIVDVEKPFMNLVYGTDPNGDVLTFISDNGHVVVSEDIKTLYYLTTRDSGDVFKDSIEGQIATIGGLLQSIFIFSQKNKPNVVYDLLGKLGDVKLIKNYTNAYGKQNLYKFVALVDSLIKDVSLRFSEGIDYNLIPENNAYCLIDLFNDLANANVNWFPRHKLFKYKTIGAKKVQSKKLDTKTYDELLVLLNDLKDNDLDTNKVSDMQAILDKLNDKTFDLVFKHGDDNPKASFRNIVWNEDRPNISFRAMYHGSVAVPNNEWNIEAVDTFIYRNYTFVKDGIVNVEKLVVDLPYNLVYELGAIDGLIEPIEGDLWVINLTKLPVVNRGMVKEASAVTLATKSYELLKLKATQKVANHYGKLLDPKVSKSFVETYGEDATNWLTELGITSFNGFTPKTTDEKTGETYMATELNVKLAGLSSLPKVEDVEAKLVTENAKFKPSESLLALGIKDYRTSVKADDLDSLNAFRTRIIEDTRKCSTDIAKIKFAVILGQTWFTEFASMDENEIVINVDDQSIKVKLELADKTIEL